MTNSSAVSQVGIEIQPFLHRNRSLLKLLVITATDAVRRVIAVIYGEIRVALVSSARPSAATWSISPTSTWFAQKAAYTLAQMGRLIEARETLVKARARHHEIETPFREANFLARAEAQIAVTERDWQSAWQVFEKASSGFGRMGARWEYARIVQEWANAHISRGRGEDLEAAGRLLRQAGAEYEEMELDYYAQEVRQQLSSLNLNQ